MTIKINDVTIECGDGVSVEIEGETIRINAQPLNVQPLMIPPTYPLPNYPNPWYPGPTCKPYEVTWYGNGTSCGSYSMEAH